MSPSIGEIDLSVQYIATEELVDPTKTTSKDIPRTLDENRMSSKSELKVAKTEEKRNEDNRRDQDRKSNKYKDICLSLFRVDVLVDIRKFFLDQEGSQNDAM